MRQNIKILPPEITVLIAAGEVVERPASVVKELVENALDAEAKAISIHLREGGLSLIRVSDDGHGMSRSNALLSIQPFATSKISTPADLQAIRSYGFRGEALSSIAAIAQLDILTRTGDEIEGTRVTAHNGQANAGPAASPVGTSVTVSRLFVSTPARRKFLKAPLRELELAQQVVSKYALAHPQVAFRLTADGRPRLTLPSGSPLERIGAVWGREIAGEMTPIEWEAMDLRIRGFISKPAIARSRRNRQVFFVNHRPVQSGLLAVMLERPFAGLLPPGRYPLAVIHIRLDPAFVDVNVHPQKSTVRFSRERRVYSALSQSVGDALSGFPRQNEEENNAFLWPFAGWETFDSLREEETPYQVSPLRPLAQIHHTYILAESAETVLIVDQHTAHEQVLYERITANSADSAKVTPIQITLTAVESNLLTAHLSLLTQLGFEIAPFGGHTFLIRQVPAALKPHLSNQVAHSTQPYEATLLTTLLEELQTYKSRSPDDQRDKLAQKAACVCALKAGDALTMETMKTLLDELIKTWSPASCPHGRPVFVTLSLAEIERRFGRR